MTRWLCALALLLPSLSCSGGANSLDGSLSQMYDVSYDNVSILLQGTAVSIQYLKSDGSGWVVVADTANIVDVSGSTIDLTQPLVSGQPRGVLEYVGAVTTDFSLQRGSIVFDQVPKVGTKLTGNFATTTSKPSGYTLDGNFSATVTAP